MIGVTAASCDLFNDEPYNRTLNLGLRSARNRGRERTEITAGRFVSPAPVPLRQADGWSGTR